MNENMSNDNVMRYGDNHTGLDQYYWNEKAFPILANMEEAQILKVDSWKSWCRKENTVTFQTEGVFYHKRYFYRFLDYRAAFDRLERSRNICVRITVCSPHVIRIQAEQGFAVKERSSEMLVTDLSDPIFFTLTEKENALILETSDLTVTVRKNPWNIELADKNGKVFFRQYDTHRVDNPIMRYEHCPFGFLYDTKEGKMYASEQIEYRDEEHFFGFGEKFTDLDKRGQNVDLWNTNCLCTNTVRTYKNIPFFMSTAGYGVFMHTSNAINCNMGQHFNKTYSMTTEDSVVDYFVIHGPVMKDIIRRYTDLTGKTPLPPKWSYGFWISKISYRSQEEVEYLEKRFREEKIPCDVIHLDTDWYEYNWVCDYKFSTSRFPDPAGMLKEAKEKGFHISLWQMPYIENNAEHPNPVFEEGFRKGYFAYREDGTYDFEHGLIDVSNPEAVSWYQEKLLRPLLEMGVAAIKVDFGESIPEFYHYAGVDSDKMHNLYPLLYNKAVFEITEKVHGKGQGIIWARSSWAGSQRYPLHWGGDCDTDFHALVTTVKAGLSLGLCGFPFWSHDIGGFHSPTTPEVYARWMQVGCFSSHSRAHGVKTREPWDFGEQVKDITRKYLNLRYQLMPYIYSQSYACTKTSLPMFRALILEYQNDRNVYGIDSQYLFGDSFLVVPIMDETNERDAYLPEGIWTDYWTKEQVKGGKWIHVQADLDKLPLYIRENAIIPMGPIQQYVDEVPLTEVTWDLYPVCGKNSFLLYDGEEKNELTMEACGEGIRITVKNSKVGNRFVLNNVLAESVLMNGVKTEFCAEGRSVVFAAEGQEDLVIEVK